MMAMTGLLQFLGGTFLLFKKSVQEMFRPPYYHSLLIEQIYNVGVKSMPLVLIVAASTGMVMTLQFGVGLAKFGGKLYVPNIVTVSLVRELGPVFACLMIASRIGAGFTSEIGSMKVTEQLDAIRALGTSPIKKIVVPRILACMIAVPILSAMATFIGIAGGIVVGVFDLNLDPLFYYQKVTAAVHHPDYFSGLGKTFFFALIISVTACYYGLNVKGGTRGVGKATTQSVVVSSIAVVIGDYFLTKLFLFFEAGF